MEAAVRDDFADWESVSGHATSSHLAAQPSDLITLDSFSVGHKARPAEPASQLENFTELQLVLSALGAIPPDLVREEWVKVLFALRDAEDLAAPEDRRELAVGWSRGDLAGTPYPRFSEQAFNDIWNGRANGGASSAGLGTIFNLARGYGWVRPISRRLPESKDNQEWRRIFDSLDPGAAQSHAYFSRKLPGFPKWKSPLGLPESLACRRRPKSDKQTEEQRALAFAIVDPRGRIYGIQDYDPCAPKGRDRKNAKGSMYPGRFIAPFCGADPLTDYEPKRILIAEGVASAASGQLAFHMHDHREVVAGVAAISSGNVPAVAENLRRAFPDAALVLLGENDEASKKAVDKVARMRLGNVFVAWPASDQAGADFNDDHLAYGLEAVLGRIEAAEPLLAPTAVDAAGAALPLPHGDVEYLLFGDKGPTPCEVNAAQWLKVAFADKIALDLFDGKVRVDGVEMQDRHANTILHQAQAKTRIKFSAGHIQSAVLERARHNGRHPLKERIESVAWDGIPRIDTWLSDYLGVEDTPLVRAKGRKWLIEGISRVYEPGCQADYTLLLIGNQGLRKSTALRTLAMDPRWFQDSLPALNDKDAMQCLSGKFIIELAELDKLKKAEASEMKAYLTRRVDSFRPSYGRLVEDRARQCIFAATSNSDQPLPFDTENRRFWKVVITGLIDHAALEGAVQQLWAEALVAWRAGEIGVIDDPNLADELKEEQATLSYRAPEPWDEVIAEKLEGKLKECVHLGTGACWVSNEEIYAILEISPDRRSGQTGQRIASVMRAAGWEQGYLPRALVEGRKIRGWTKAAPV